MRQFEDVLKSNKYVQPCRCPVLALRVGLHFGVSRLLSEWNATYRRCLDKPSSHVRLTRANPLSIDGTADSLIALTGEAICGTFKNLRLSRSFSLQPRNRLWPRFVAKAIIKTFSARFAAFNQGAKVVCTSCDMRGATPPRCANCANPLSWAYPRFKARWPITRVVLM